MQEIKEMYDLFYRAFYNVSFSPDKRAESCVKDFSEELSSDLSELGHNRCRYKEKYLSKLADWANAKSRCLSSMITGPANFPVERNRKNNAAEQNKWEHFRYWREKYFKAVNRVRTPSPEEDLDNALRELDSAIECQEMMKIANKIIRQKSLSKEEKVSELITLGLKEPNALAIMVPDYMGGLGFAGYALSNNNAKIKRLKEKVLTMKARIERKESFEPIEFEGGSINIEADRVVIYHDTKPEKDVIDTLKSNGFRWSPKMQCWCRKHTLNALIAAKRICQNK